MMAMIRRIVLVMAVLGLLVGASGSAQAEEINLILNGGFEESGGSLDHWIHVNQGAGDWYLQSGRVSPDSGYPVPQPPQGSYAAMSDDHVNGSHVLYQPFVVPANISTATLGFDMFIGNRAGAFFTPAPATLDYDIVNPNQQARVDIITSAANPFSVAPNDVLSNLFQTHPGDPLVSSDYALQANDLKSLLQGHEGETLLLRFAETDNRGSFQFGVDDVRLIVTASSVIPEPSTLVMAGGAAVMCLGYYWCGRERAAP
jgi:hypothetical protein